MIDELRRANIFREVLVNGSFVTAQAEPNDIDLILVLPANWDFAADLTPDVYNLFSKNRVRKRFGFDIFIVREKSFEYETDLDFLQQVRQPPGGRKGLLRLRL